jgi:hypothetical protein
MPYLFFIGPNAFFRNLAICFYGFYFLINIIACLKSLNWIICILNILDGFLVISSISTCVFLTILAIDNPEEGGFVFIIYPILAAIIFFGISGLFLNNKSSFRNRSGIERNKV